MSYYLRLGKKKLPNYCEICRKKGKLLIHHKNKNRKDNRIENLQRVCYSCHNSILHKDTKYTPFVKGRKVSEKTKTKQRHGYKDKICEICNKNFKPISGKARVCEECRNPICPKCGSKVRFTSSIKLLKQRKTCKKCFLENRFHSKETKEKIRKAILGKRHSEETKQKMKISRRRYLNGIETKI